MKEMNDVLCKLLWGYLQLMGLCPYAHMDKKAMINDFKTKTALLNLYDRWLEESIEVLARNHYFYRKGDSYSVTDTALVDLQAVWKEWELKKGEWLKNPDLSAWVVLVESTLRKLPEILTGNIPATDIVFPQSSMKLVEGIYKNSPAADYFNEVLGDIVVSYLNERLKHDPSGSIRIIEIGAGTGGTSAMLFRKLRPYQEHIREYCYTDKSRAFLLHAQKEYGPQNPYLTYKIFNVEESAVGQDIETGGYDIAIATNVLHATRNIRQTLGNVKAALRKNGLILINEISGNSLLNHLTFGLLEGWWLYNDPELRIPGSPGLYPERWQEVLESEGFRSVFFPAQEAHEVGQQIIVAESDGKLSDEMLRDQQKLEQGKPPLEQRDTGTQSAADVTDEMAEEHVRELIVEKLAEALNVDISMIDVHESFADYGLDSILGVNFVQDVNQGLGIHLQTTDIFDYSSVKQLTLYILGQFGDIVLPVLGHNADPIEDGKDTSRETQAPKEKEYMFNPVQTASASIEPERPKQENTGKSLAQREPIAIIGMSGRFAGSDNVDELWNHLKNGDDLVKEVTRWDLSKYQEKNASYCNYGSFLEDIDKFDPLFFNISGLEATYMDPQQRLFLEEAWHALEDAGYAGAGMDGRRCGVYVGCAEGDYQRLLGEDLPPQALWGHMGSVIPARISYYLNLHGPAIAVDTACSSSLVATHLACQSLWSGETDMALAGGVYIHTTPRCYLYGDRAGMLSHTGHCYTFDDRADGMVPGEAVGAVVLKRLEEAVADGDHIYGVILGSGINQDGTTNGLTAPSQKSQERLEQYVYDTFHIHPEQIQLVEAHGTGTKLGDPIEYQALTRTFRKYTDKKGFCAIGSIKTNIGHTQIAAGITGVIKLLLSLKHEQIPPSLHFQSGNSNIQFADSPFFVNTQLQNWLIEPEARRCAAVSSFGASGTNAHLVIEEAPHTKRRHCEKPAYFIPLSARTSQQLRRQVEQLIAYCEQEPEADCGNMSYTLLLGRKHCNHRLACVARNQGELVMSLKRWLEKGNSSQVYYSELHEKDQRIQTSLKRYGNECIQNCQNAGEAREYLELLTTIADLYVQGYPLDFERLFSNEPYCRIPLPTYPFAKERYWAPRNETQVAKSISIESETKSTISRAEAKPVATASHTLLLEPVWKEQDVSPEVEAPTYDRRIILLCEPDKALPERLEARLNGAAQILAFSSGKSRVDERFQAYAVQAFESIQSILKDKPAGRVLVQLVVTAAGEGQLFSGLSGLLKTARLENPKLIGQLIEVEQGESAESMLAKLEENSRSSVDGWIRYEGVQRKTACWSRFESSRPEEKLPWRDGGVYLITGGSGGLGLLVAEELVRRTQAATLILTGRSPLDGNRQTRLKELESLGARVVYKQGDITDRNTVTSLLESIQKEFGRVHGIIHCAGIIHDNFILKKSREEFIEVLGPKVQGLVHLDEASSGQDLDFFVLFSSISGSMGNPGQADYATANAFMDAYAAYRNTLVEAQQRRGRTLSIRWPLWKEGGMRIDADTEKLMRQNMGITPLQTESGIQALYQCLTSSKDQVMVLEGEPEKIEAYLAKAVSQAGIRAIQASAPKLDAGLLYDKTLYHLKALLGEVTRLSVGSIEAQEPLERYGIDSIMITQLNAKLAESFGELSKTLFYEYQTLRALAEYLVAEYAPECMQWVGMSLDKERIEETAATARYAEEESTPVAEQTIAETVATKSSRSYVKPVRSCAESVAEETREPIAIIGMAGKYPGSRDMNEYWENLKAGKDCVSEIPQERWKLEGFFHPDKEEAASHGKSYSKWGGFIEGFAEFDPLFFNIAPREALSMDPQERLFIEACWEAMEDAGYTREQLAVRHNSRVGVFAGITKTGFDLYGLDLWRKGAQIFPHTSFSSVANRISYLFNLQGPSMPVDTMCSSSLTAIHEACEHLYRGECELAMAGGVNLYLHPLSYVGLCANQMLSVDGQCKSFGKGGNGFVPGEGVGVVLLKPLSKAIADGDPIHAVIRGTSINHGGKTNGYTVPNPTAQGELIRSALERAGVHARTISYIEAHGTGTELGDPIEVTGLTQAFRKDTADKGFCAVGSVKSNIGHLEAAAGIAGIGKIVLQMKNRTLVPSLHAQELNPNIPFEQTPFVVQQELEEWKRPVVELDGETREYPRMAGISSFGAGGANAHVIIAEYVPEEKMPIRVTAHHPVIIVLSAKNEERLKQQVERLLSVIEKGEVTESNLADAAYTLQVGREAMEERLAVIAESMPALVEKLEGFMKDQTGISELYRGQVKRNKDALSALVEDEDMGKTIAAWIGKRKYAKIVDLWVKGLAMDWSMLYGDAKPQRMSLPAYPFAKERYWVTDITIPSVEKIPMESQEKAVLVQSQVMQSALPEALMPSSFSSSSQKPSGISLRNLSDSQPQLSKSANQQTAPIILTSPEGVMHTSDNDNETEEQVPASPALSISSEILQEELTTSLAQALYIDRDEIDEDKNFVDLGLDSIIGVEWIRNINKHYDTSITATKVYDYPTIREFSKFLEKELGNRVAQLIMPSSAASILDQAPAKHLPPLVSLETDKQTEASLQINLMPISPEKQPQFGTILSGVSTEQLRKELTASLAEALYMEQSEIEADRNFIDIGLDSIIGVEWIRNLNKRYGTSIAATKVYDYPTILQFTEFLAQEINKHGGKKSFVQQPLNTVSDTVKPIAEVHLPRPETIQCSPAQLPKEETVPLRRVKAEEESVPATSENQDAIAIVGISGRYPGAEDVQQYWKNLAQGQNSIVEIPKNRWDVDPLYDPRPAQEGKVNCKWLGALKDIEYFDPLFFNISPTEAEGMDPQQRIFLQEAYKAFEDAGYSGSQLGNKKCGVYLGILNNEYSMMRYKNEAQFSNTTGNSNAIAAARISYFLNLKGPAISVDTACSSSLVATHLACQALSNKEIEMALVGGVSLYLTPESYIGMSASGMLSPDGQCKTFDNSANGFVPGEGAGVLVLKRLKDAEADRDHIYGVIIGTGINQDGKTNGITAPSTNSQIELEQEIYNKYQIEPESISYVEMHGTGTKLGDPIELEALCTAFKEKTDQKKFCAIGSVKSNIGHTSAAAGVASMQKVLLCMKHKKLVPTLNFKNPNEHFDFDDSPFYVNTQLKDWQPSRGNKRRAAVSSFGFSGTNAHLIIEEYRPETAISPADDESHSPVLFVLSAKNEQQLVTYAENMRNFIATQPNLNLTDMGYTLQVSREPMNHRLAFVADSKENLLQALDGLVHHQRPAGVLTAQVKKGKDGIVLFEADEDAKSLLETWIKKRKLGKIAELWVQGLTMDWNKLYGNIKPRRISLPTYPFAKERCWAPELDSKACKGTASVMAATLHPLLHQNTSDFSEQRFSSSFTGQEFFLKDHVVNGRKVLSGAASLEMARAAVEQSLGTDEGDLVGMCLKNVVWARPIAVEDGPIQLHIGLFQNEDQEISYEIYGNNGADYTELSVYSYGNAVRRSAVEVPALNIKDLQDTCSRNFHPAALYNLFRELGIDYGPGHQGIEMVYAGEGQVLAKLSLPSSVSDNQGQFVLHPSMIDSAFQASIGLTLGSREIKPALPYAIQEVEIIKHCSSTMWALIRYSADDTAGDKAQKLDIDLSDETGEICVRIKGYSSRILDIDSIPTDAQSNSGTLMLEPVWKEQGVSIEGDLPVYDRHVVILCQPSQISREQVEAQISGAKCIILQPDQNGIGEQFQYYAVQILELIQRIFREKNHGKVLIQIVTNDQEEQQLVSGLSGLLKTSRIEHPKLVGQLIELEQDKAPNTIIDILKENSWSPGDIQIRYGKGKRWIFSWNEIPFSPETADMPWKENGVYLITGGAGGLGLIFAKEIANKVHNVVLILTGRSALDEGKRAEIKKLESLGARIAYKQADVTREQVVADLIRGIEAEFGSLNGIIHSAGVIRDNRILQKNSEEMLEVLAPKVLGVVNLDQASKHLPLDFFIMFSSVAGGLGNQGQADYSTANAFMDAYARYRSTLTGSQQRQGQTLSINWPLWKEGGMHIDEETEKLVKQHTGMGSISTSSGIQALYRAMLTDANQVMVLEGNLEKMKRTIGLEIPETRQLEKAAGASASISAISTTDGNAAPDLLDKVQIAMMQAVSKLLKVKLEDIDAYVELSEYGFDSILLTQFANNINHLYRLELTPAVFFEYTTLHDFCRYLVEEYATLLGEQFVVQTRTEPAVQNEEDDREDSIRSRSQRSRFANENVLAMPQQTQAGSEPIAIVGISGVFPMARDVDEFWKNLEEGRDCITEIPEDRWDWKAYYGDPAEETNKTNIKWGGFIDGIYEFDPLFFGISPREAALMDPQQRLLMTYIWKAIEDAGIPAAGLSGTHTGIFAGTANSGYSGMIYQGDVGVEAYSSSGMAPSVGPNRMSYFLNIHGPSEPVETACSSSLVAIHRAVKAIEDGSCEMAIAGGVNVIITPELHISFNKAGMLCEDGRCKTFSDQANGYVRGEGAGMVFLKKLKDAEKAGDHIYGVIRGTAVNHGGRANSLTAPNPRAQADLLVNAYTKAGIDPRTVSYIEAHGTGTELGDPIEINGLKAAFKELYESTKGPGIKEPHCGLGSVKTNVGHLELAAGIAGVIKVLLQLKHKKLVKSLHCDAINPYIKLEDSPFYIVQETSEWKQQQDASGHNIPRRAGVSSFGFGGVNAHLIIEEYVPENQEKDPVTFATEKPAIVVLSAKTEGQLQDQARQLLAAIQERQFTDGSLGDIAYTLQMGREAMEERLAFTAVSLSELEEKLKGFVEGREGIPSLYVGQAKRYREQETRAGAAETIESLASESDYAQIAHLWVKGAFFDWDVLYEKHKPNRISLPTYPFAKERYCVTDTNNLSGANDIGPKQEKSAIIHPLLQRNTSDIYGLQFSSTFTGREFFLADHVIKGQKLLPGVAYLEMARAAVEEVATPSEVNGICVRLKDVLWLRPVVAGERPIAINIGLYPQDGGEIAYEIYSKSESVDTELVVHSEGSVAIAPLAEIPAIDIEALLEQCNLGTYSSQQCYEAFAAMQVSYGPGHQGIEKIYTGVDQVLAKLSLPTSVYQTMGQFVMHPSLMDSALQASIGLMMDTYGAAMSDGKASIKSKPALPFAVEELEVFSGCTSEMWAWVRNREGSRQDGPVQKLDIDLCDMQGNVCVSMKGLTSRIAEGGTGGSDELTLSETLMLEPVWEEQALVSGGTAPEYRQHLVILCEPAHISGEMIESQMNGVHCLILQSEEESMDARFRTYAAQVFEQIQQVLKTQSKHKTLVQLIIPVQDYRQVFSGLYGLLQTAQIENPTLAGQLIEVDMEEDAAGIINILQENSRNFMSSHIRYQWGRRYAAAWTEIKSSQEVNCIPWKDKGVYLITGGTGSLGLILAEEMARQAKDVALILVGRSILRGHTKARIEEIEALGARVVFRQADVDDNRAVEDLVRDIREEFGKLDGIIHGAGVTSDNFMIKKTEEELQKVLAPKVTGLTNLDQACKDIPLDFFILFSSVAGSLGNIGQADYAAANAFMDAYARYRNTLVEQKQRYGQTLSINWPLWKEGGMRIDSETEQIMEEMGMFAMGTDTGMRALYQSLASGKDQVMVLEGRASQLRETLLQQPSLNQVEDASSMIMESRKEPGIGQDLLVEKAANYLKQLLATSIRLPARQIEADAPMEKYGIDSIMIRQLTRELEKTFGTLPKTLFFEYQSIRELTQYFLEVHQKQLIQLLGMEEKVNAVQAFTSSTVKENPERPLSSSRRQARKMPAQAKLLDQKKLQPQPEAAGGTGDIAIIGLSGMYPEAENVEEFWNNLRNGKDCITEIPKERWDHSIYFDEEGSKSGKAYSKWGGFIKGVDQFDPKFFNISPREAEIIDPQERLFLKCVYETIEDAGYTREGLGLERNVGVFVGVMYEEYQLYGAQEQARGKMIAVPGNPASIANRVSYFCNFHGPSMAVDTMCSSSLTTIHLACQSLQQDECELAVAGGVNVSIHPNKYLMLGQGRFVSSKGRCESFGEGGDGYVPGEGVGAVLLKPLTKAIADGDHIYGVIKGTAVNHGGKTNGFSVPNPKAQASVIGRVFKKAGINPRTISYIEAHGTGTSLGDPIEIAGLQKVFQEYTEDTQFCAIGSAKSNIGHCESAAGIAGVTKVLLQLKYGQIAPSLHSSTLNQNIDFSNSPFIVQQELEDWKRPVATINGKTAEYPRIAGISSFGAGGSNAHVLIEEYIPEVQETRQAPMILQNSAIVVLSAKNQERLYEQVQRLLSALRAPEYADASLGDIAFTLQVGREAMEERLAVIAKSTTELEGKLESFLAGNEEIDGLYSGQAKKNKDILTVLEADEDMEQLVDIWISKSKYTKLAELWVQGLLFDWNRLYGKVRPHRMSLPTYPFAKESYWISTFGSQSKEVKTELPVVDIPAQKQEPVVFSPPTANANVQVQTLAKVPEKPQGILLRSVSNIEKVADAPKKAAKPAELKPAPPQPKPINSTPQPAVRDEAKRPANGPTAVRVDALEKELIKSLAKSLSMDEKDIGRDDKFIDMGLDSIIGVEWVQDVNKRFGTAISATRVYDYPNIKEFSKYLAKELSKSAGASNQVPVESTSTQPMQALIQKVLQGELNVEQADQLFKQLHS
ncbi:SDR family NAD(P)-dependent oxidoreductase [Paenibacillus polymyxa]|uniref:SDR family NAD(P)-dependent oxidoreductase n=1 Tax=Paenibacillus polymyxa TaxID=1406 RepID=UPI0020252622|nr:SDR family NAD(P)-dependent oxidoreductase [Paenibacillus polymyxa]MDU8671978.1 SDR family NAD(P)-dependent oxidoreductase [Paenibacillus polymyxa]MDU8696887.1 SDR family NAD(P)-dependent oxidoreductase [Paenibacillus polymyxa]URJ70594.1 SDR family NAD(P)-dependent oxidoreductase [Paenibacillus polymyxa]WDZ61392.1 SDR family NAD(P)-dependent oxidoreductase [Paenibacillus polymyxa]WEC95062.1 SDR family NAD(P)-dependent oxidoreductase [Paenibacillus polymyxa]